MTVKELIDQVDRLHPNQYSATDKLRWLNEAESTVWREIVQTHEEGQRIEMPVYTAVESTEELLAPEPYSRLYGLWMDAQIAYADRESGAYEAAATAFNSAYGDFWRWYNREHTPLRKATHISLTDRTWEV